MKISLRGAIGLALTIGLLWWVFHDVPWHEVMEHLRRTNPWLTALAVAVGTCMFPLRARRWRPILDPIAPNLAFSPLWRSTAIGMMANNVLPARAGEIVRAFMLSRLTPVPFSASFASLVVDRAFDAVVVLLLMVLAMFDPAFPAEATIGGRPASHAAGAGLVLVVVVATALYAIVFFPDRLIKLYELFARRVAPRFEERGRVMLRSFADGLSVLRHPGLDRRQPAARLRERAAGELGAGELATAAALTGAAHDVRNSGLMAIRVRSALWRPPR